MQRKSGVTLGGIRPELVMAALLLDSLWQREFGFEATITSCTDGQHGVHSLHPKGYAIDLRTRNLDPGEVPLLKAKVLDILGPEFDVVLEHLGEPEEHLHAEFDPKV